MHPPPPEKSHPLLFQQPPSKSRGPVKPPFLKIWFEVQSPLAEGGGRLHTMAAESCGFVLVCITIWPISEHQGLKGYFGSMDEGAEEIF